MCSVCVPTRNWSCYQFPRPALGAIRVVDVQGHDTELLGCVASALLNDIILLLVPVVADLSIVTST